MNKLLGVKVYLCTHKHNIAKNYVEYNDRVTGVNNQLEVGKWDCFRIRVPRVISLPVNFFTVLCFNSAGQKNVLGIQSNIINISKNSLDLYNCICYQQHNSFLKKYIHQLRYNIPRYNLSRYFELHNQLIFIDFFRFSIWNNIASKKYKISLFPTMQYYFFKYLLNQCYFF